MSNIGKTYEDEQANLFLETKTKIVNNVFELGRILVETKEQLGHGNFTKWIKDSRVNMTPRNCQRYVKVYETFQMRHGMSLLSDLSLNNLYDLAQLPQEDREQMIESSETSKELVKKLKEYKKQQKEEKEKKQEEENIEETQQQEEEKNIGQQIEEVIIEQVDVDFESKRSKNSSARNNIKNIREDIHSFLSSDDFRNSDEDIKSGIVEELKQMINEIEEQISLPTIITNAYYREVKYNEDGTIWDIDNIE